MTIKKQLKNVKFSYCFDNKTLYIHTQRESENPTTGNIEVLNSMVEITRVELFSLARFILRIAQKGNPKKVVTEQANQTAPDEQYENN